MLLEDFIITVFCFIDDELEKILLGHKLRTRGRKPGMTDSEVLTMEIIGEFLEIDSDKGIWSYFQIHWKHFFPDISDRIWRKLLAHTTCIKVNIEKGNEPLQFDLLVC